MIVKRFYDERLAQASFMVGCPGSGEAIVIDPSRIVEPYLEAAAAEGLRITGVTETHIHADYVSGSRELGATTGATIYLSDEGDADWKYGYANDPNVRLVKDGDEIRTGAVRLVVRHTPGHTPEHISFVLYDESASEEPLGAFTGDFIFVGDVGRPDLLERAANIKGTMEKGARVLYNSLRKFVEYPDHLILWPGHGAGSACGKSLGGVPVTSLGYEKRSGWAFQTAGEQDFVEEVLAGQPEPPKYFAHMKRINKEGPPILGAISIPPRKQTDELMRLLDAGATIFDMRPAGEAAAGLIPGTINVPFEKSFTTWAGWFAPYDAPIYLISENETEVLEAVKALATIGIDQVGAWFGHEVVDEHQKSRDLATIGQMQAREAKERLDAGEVTIVDVRGASEYEEGHIPGSIHVPLGYLADRADSIPKDKPVVFQCYAGGRSSIGASLWVKLGNPPPLNFVGGFEEYEAQGLEVETGSGKEPVHA
ncbi:MBL fold metallo-hydrolase [Fimbriimonadia bacterium ATM]|nr:MAG: MBL fold metallo-hydrolase [Armatimonadota bacterium]MBC6970780.1 MBL fold metallo-hydrolase [Armatimonadota bacterium]MCE7900919.1 MBL fold metallo-hydrolase [Armatimonadetes bacterium ATM1]MDL1929666.1 MBL fold metallo-hydrolase [Fimbriimonadia bacterium ATM]RIJ94814.1 MAG: MBL fold metallo-hydrolase [Armatimonadota bacterium]